MDDLIEIVLTGPAKIGGARKKAGDSARVSPAELTDLRAAGVVAADVDAPAPVEEALPSLAEAAMQARIAELETQVADLTAALAEATQAPAGDAAQSAVKPVEPVAPAKKGGRTKAAAADGAKG